jgi:Glycosyl hydrolase family 99/Dockerin type I domain
MKSRVSGCLAIVFALMAFAGNSRTAKAQTATSFRFGVWADTKSGTAVLNSDSVNMWNKTPLFLFYPGDVCSSGPNATCLDVWKTNYNAGGDLLSKSFPSRGNHDSSGTSVWVSFFNVAAVAAKIEATNLTQLSTNLTYSFDWGNSHFAAVDMPGGDATTMSSAQLNWLDNDLTAAESRGLTHAFVFFHGPEYPMGGHCCTNAVNIAQMLGRHTIVSASFHGHEHNLAYAHIDSSKITGVIHSYEEFTSGGAGADLYGCQRGEWCDSTDGFMTVDVNSSMFTVSAFNSAGGLLKSWTFNKSAISSPTLTPKPSLTPTITPTPVIPSVLPTGIPVATPTQVVEQDKQPSLPVRAAFYYPWFPEAWTQSSHYPYTNYHPSLGFYSTVDSATLNNQIQALLYGRFHAGISSWWGQGDYTDVRLVNLLRAADNTDFRWTVYYEPEGQGDPTVSQLQNDLNYIKNHYGLDRNYFRIGGKPVIFVYADSADGCIMADRWKQANTMGFYVVLKVFSGYSSCSSQPDNWHQYSPAVAEDKQTGHSFSISPGFYKYGEISPRLVRNVTTWNSNIRDMINSGAPFQLVTTFNEWGEGSAVESATEWSNTEGYGVYLEALHNNGIVPSATPIPTVGPSPTPKSVPINGDADNDGKVDMTDYQIFLFNYNQTTGKGQAAGDFNFDGKVDGLDYVIWLNTYTG